MVTDGRYYLPFYYATKPMEFYTNNVPYIPTVNAAELIRMVEGPLASSFSLYQEDIVEIETYLLWIEDDLKEHKMDDAKERADTVLKRFYNALGKMKRSLSPYEYSGAEEYLKEFHGKLRAWIEGGK